jgi:hypothetical protein
MADNFENMPYVADYSDEHRKIHAQKPWEKLNKSPDLPVIKRHLEEKTRDAQNRRVLSDKV